VLFRSTMSSIGVPALNGFIGEFTILQGVFEVNKIWAAFAVSGIVLGAAYMLWLYQRTMFGPVTNEKNKNLKDLNWREIMTLAPLVVCAFWIGLYPKPFFKVLEKPVAQIVERVQPGYFARKGIPSPLAEPGSTTPVTQIEPAPAAGSSSAAPATPAETIR
jgi:NADH-quinone oxidoreductase subunit M